MIGSHLTLNRSLATYIMLLRLQPQPLPPSYREKLVTRLVDISHPFFSLLHMLCNDLGFQRSSTTLLLDAFAETQRRLGRRIPAESLDPCGRGNGVLYLSH